MLKELIREKVDEIFLTYQEAKNIISGDIEPLDALQLEQIEESLRELIERVCEYQPKGYSASYTYETGEGIEYHKAFKQIDANKFFTEVSNIIAFGDCTDFTVVNICFDGKEIKYVGWQPGMKFEYKDLDGNTVWVGNFPEWDH